MYKLILTTILFFFTTTSSFAYLGAGMGGGAIAATIGIIVAIFADFFMNFAVLLTTSRIHFSHRF